MKIELPHRILQRVESEPQTFIAYCFNCDKVIGFAGKGDHYNTLLAQAQDHTHDLNHDVKILETERFN